MLGIEDYVSVETARVLHEKGYSGMITAATLYEVQMWLIRKGLFVNIQYYTGDCYNYEILTVPDHALVGLADRSAAYWGSYQEALSKGIEEALKLI